MKENITVELKSKEALAYDQEQVKEWMDDLVHLIVKNKYEKHNIIDVLDQPIGHDLFWAMSLDEWLKFRGYFSWKDAINLNKKKLEIFGNLEELNTAKSSASTSMSPNILLTSLLSNFSAPSNSASISTDNKPKKIRPLI